jgi:hypothetical protein
MKRDWNGLEWDLSLSDCHYFVILLSVLYLKCEMMMMGQLLAG